MSCGTPQGTSGKRFRCDGCLWLQPENYRERVCGGVDETVSGVGK